MRIHACGDLRIAGIGAVLIALASSTVVQATIVRFQTTSGNIDFRLYETATPGHAANLLAYVNSDRYDGTFIHRSAKKAGNIDFVIQGGGFEILTSLLEQPAGSGWTSVPTFGTVTNEPGISNLRGTIALAKVGSDPNSGTSQWFFNLDDNSFLDSPANNEFTVFGRIVGNGLNVADEIAGLDRVNAGSPFSEVPVNDLDKVLGQGDLFNEDVVRIIDAFVRDLPAGDYNLNGVGDAADLVRWERDYNFTTRALADGDGSGHVTGADFLIWQRTFGESAASPAAMPTPEPGAALLAILGGACFAFRRRRCTAD